MGRNSKGGFVLSILRLSGSIPYIYLRMVTNKTIFPKQLPKGGQTHFRHTVGGQAFKNTTDCFAESVQLSRVRHQIHILTESQRPHKSSDVREKTARPGAAIATTGSSSNKDCLQLPDRYRSSPKNPTHANKPKPKPTLRTFKIHKNC